MSWFSWLGRKKEHDPEMAKLDAAMARIDRAKAEIENGAASTNLELTQQIERARVMGVEAMGGDEEDEQGQDADGQLAGVVIENDFSDAEESIG